MVAECDELLPYTTFDFLERNFLYMAYGVMGRKSAFKFDGGGHDGLEGRNDGMDTQGR